MITTITPTSNGATKTISNCDKLTHPLACAVSHLLGVATDLLYLIVTDVATTN